jgi:hypothetical protein
MRCKPAFTLQNLLNSIRVEQTAFDIRGADISERSLAAGSSAEQK